MKCIIKLFEDLRSTPKGNEKKKILESSKEWNDGLITLKMVINFAYNPHIQFRIGGATIKKAKKLSNGTNDDISTVLSYLHSRSEAVSITNADRDILYDLIEDITPDLSDLLLKVLNKDLRIGCSASTFNKIWPDFIPVYEVQLANLVDNKISLHALLDGNPDVIWMASLKIDGLRILAEREEVGHILKSRAGKVKKAPVILKEIENFVENITLDGEIAGDDWNDSMSISSKDEKRKKNLVYYIFDIIDTAEWEGKVDPKMTNIDRYKYLCSVYGKYKHLMPHVTVLKQTLTNDFNTIWNMYEDALKSGIEGLILKPMHGVYDKTRSWIKMKPKDTCDCEIIDTVEGKGKLKGKLGAFIVLYNSNPMKIGTGTQIECPITGKMITSMSDEYREELWNIRTELPSKIIETVYTEPTKNNKSLRHARFLRFRDDK